MPWLDQLGGPARSLSKGPHTLENPRERGGSQAGGDRGSREGEKARRITITLAAPAPAPAPAPVVEPGGSLHRIGPWVVGGAGVAALIAGAVTGGFVVYEHGVMKDECSDEQRTCSQRGADAQTRGQVLGPATTSLLVTVGCWSPRA